MTRSADAAIAARVVLAVALPVCLGVALTAVAQPAWAGTTITVSTCDESSLGAAVAQANSDNAGDTVDFGCSGTIDLTSALNITGNMTLDGSGQNVALDGQATVGVLSVASGVTFTLNDLTVQHGYTPGYGTGLTNAGGTVTISNSTFLDNHSGGGGAAVNNYPGGTVTISDTTFTANVASSGYGGAVNNSDNATMSITGSNFAANLTNFGPSAGGAIANFGSMTISSTVFGGNRATYGGAIYQGAPPSASSLDVTSSDFESNQATGAGAGIDVTGGTVTVTFSTFAGNIAGSNLEHEGGILKVGDSVLADGFPGNCGGGAEPTDLGYNAETGTDCGFTGTGDLQNADVDISGGLPQGSPAIDAIPLAQCPASDINGNPRPDFPSSETGCDIGAYETSYGPPIAVTSSVNPSTFGQPVTFTATVGPVDGGGTVAFTADGDGLPGCAAQPLTQVSGGTYTATCTTSSLPAGSHSITASYSGDSNYPTSTATLGQTANPAATTITLTSSANPSVQGQPVTFTATVTPTDGGGTVTFLAGSPEFGCGAQPLSPGSGGSYTATCTITGLPAGNYPITASYTGDSNYLSSTGALPGGQTVTPASTTTTVTSSDNPSGYGQLVTFTATVTPTDGSGTVGFSTDGSATPLPGCGAQSLAQASSSTYTATCTTSALAAGNHAILAAYSGDSTYPGSSGSLAGGQAVNQAPLTVTASDATMSYGGTPPAITPSYDGFVNGDGPGSLTTPPSCATAATSASPAGTYPSTCSGADGPDYAISYVTGTVTVTQAATALAYTGPASASTGATVTPAAALSSAASACQASQPVSFSLNANPVTGAAGPYPLEQATTGATGTATGAAVSTTGWQAGLYTITVSYAGTGNCGASAAAAPLEITTPGLVAAGAGSYTAPGAGLVHFGFVVARIPHLGSYAGAISVVNDGIWRLAGTLTSYLKTSSTQGTVTGTGTLSWWDPALNKHHGGWQLASRTVPFTASFNATTSTSPGTFGIQITYTPVPPQPPALPNSSPASLQTGAILMA